MKFDVNALRYMTNDEFRVLTAIEQGSKNHYIVPLTLIERIAALRHGGVHKLVSNLLRNKLVVHDAKKYDGYRLTFLGYDFLALRVFVKRGVISGVGHQIGVGKESDIFQVTNDDGDALVIKLHRLGRTSFKAIKQKRDYLQHRVSASWLYMARLAATKEFAFMKALYARGYSVPTPIDHNRHCCIMTLVPGFPLAQVRRMINPAVAYRQCMQMIVRLASHGLIHGDFNEFNLMVDNDLKVTLIDFPQMVSVGHPNSKMYFDRDVEGVRRWFARQYKYHDPQPLPRLRDLSVAECVDSEVEASGFDGDMRKDLDKLLKEQRRLDGSVEEGETAGPGFRLGQRVAVMMATACSKGSRKPLIHGNVMRCGTDKLEVFLEWKLASGKTAVAYVHPDNAALPPATKSAEVEYEEEEEEEDEGTLKPPRPIHSKKYDRLRTRGRKMKKSDVRAKLRHQRTKKSGGRGRGRGRGGKSRNRNKGKKKRNAKANALSGW